MEIINKIIINYKIMTEKKYLHKIFKNIYIYLQLKTKK